MIDYSEPFYYFGFIFGLIGFMINLVLGTILNVCISFSFSLLSLLSLWRVRMLGVSKTLMDSVDVLKVENSNLSMTNSNLRCTVSELEDQLCKTEKCIVNLNKLLGIMDTNNKTSEEIMNELSCLVEEYDKQNKLYDRNNKIALFYTVDCNRDGYLDGDEIEMLKEAVPEMKHLFTGKMSRKEVLNKLFKNTNY